MQSLKTTADGGFRITFDLSQESIEDVKKLMEWSIKDRVFAVAVMPLG